MSFEVGRSPNAAAEAFMHIWSAWAKELDSIFREMVLQMERLDISRGQITHLISTFESHPCRPTLPTEEGLSEQQKQLLAILPGIRLMQINRTWNEWADAVEGDYIDMADMLASCNAREVSDRVGDLGLPNLSLSSESLANLRPRLLALVPPMSPSRAVLGTEADELVKVMGNMNLRQKHRGAENSGLSQR